MTLVRRPATAARARWAFAWLLRLASTGCALSDDYVVGPANDAADSTEGGAPPAASTGGATSAAGKASAGAAASHGGSGVGGASGASGGSSEGGLGPAGASDGGAEPDAGAGGTDSGCILAPEVCDGVSNDCDDEIDEGDVCPADCSVKTYDGHLYALCLFADESEWVTYSEATSNCTNLGAKLGSSSAFALSWIESEIENDFLKTWIAETTPTSVQVMVWTGANDLDEELTWVWGAGANAEHFFDQSTEGGGVAYGDWFDDFAAGKPNSANDWEEDCGGFDSELDWQWNDFKCSDPRLGYVCEELP